MVRERNSKHAFWHALVFAIVVFGLGLIFGFFLESYRADKVNLDLINSEINVMDDQVRNRVVTDFNVNCDLATESVFQFADEVYEDALQLERYDAASQFGETFFILHRRYDLLRSLLWTESLELKRKCGNEVHTIVYFYEFQTEDLDKSSKQLFYSRLLLDVKLAYPNKVLLIPIAVDTDLSTVDLLTMNFGITEFPSILIDEREIVDEVVTFDDFIGIVFGMDFADPDTLGQKLI